MCLAECYKNEHKPENLMCKYVSTIGFKGDKIILTDILGEEKEVEGKLSTVDLVKNYIIIKSA